MKERNGASLESWERKSLSRFARANRLSELHPVCIALETNRLTDIARYLLQNGFASKSRVNQHYQGASTSLEQRLYTLFAE